MIRRLGTVAAGALLLAATVPAAAEVSLGGFVEGAWGARTARSPVHVDSRDYTLSEVRAQVQMEAWGDVGEAFVRFDVLQDRVVSESGEVELREGWARFTTAGDRLEVKAGRQALNWGTGDLVFVNDLFPKDWESFFSGREEQYLKAPTDVLRLGLFGLPLDVDFVWTPTFSPDRFPGPGPRFSLVPPDGTTQPARPAQTLDNSELALRLSRWLGSWALELYGYRGFFKNPQGIAVEPTQPDPVFRPFHPALNVYGASLRGDVSGTVTWAEAGWYDVREESGTDEAGRDLMVPESSLRWILGAERQVATDLTFGLQWYAEAEFPEGEDTDLSNLFTARIERLLKYQTVRLSLFGFWSPTDEDLYLRPLISWKPTDELELVLGANVFEGKSDTTRFGAFDHDDNVYTRIRWSF